MQTFDFSNLGTTGWILISVFFLPVIALIVFKIVSTIERKNKAVADKKRAEEAAEQQRQQKIEEEKAAARAFQERRSVDKQAVEENRRIPGMDYINK